MNEYLRKLNTGVRTLDLPMWREEGNILITPEGLRWRIERHPSVGDLIHAGDMVKTSYDTGGLVLSVTSYVHCCCPFRATSSTPLCEPSWDEPEQTLKFHREVVTWSIVYVRPGSRQTRSGKFHESDFCYLNEIVAFEGRFLALYEANDDEVFLVNKHVDIKPMQLDLF